MSAKIRIYRNTELFAAKLLTELLDLNITTAVNFIRFDLASWHMQIVLDSVNDVISIEDYIAEEARWRKVVTLTFNRQTFVTELSVNTDLGAINTRIQKLILFLMLHVRHNGRNFSI